MDPALQSELEGIEKDIENLTCTLRVTPNDNPNRMPLLVGLGKALDDRFDILHEPNDNFQSIENWTIALTLTPDDHPLMRSLLDSLGTAHGKRFQGLGEMKDIDQSIEYACRALAMTPDGHQNLPRQLGNLGAAHRERFGSLGNIEDIQRALEYDSRAIILSLNNYPQFPSALANMGSSYSFRFQCLGNLTDLEKAIECHSRAIALVPDDHPRLSLWLNNLGASHSYRFEHLGDLTDLEKTIQYESRALDLTPEGHPRWSSTLANLGTTYSYRFQRLGELADLEKAIQCGSRALDLTSEDHPHLSSRLANLGTSHRYRFERLGKLDDLNKAIQYQSRAVGLTHNDHPHFPGMLDHIGTSYSFRFERLGELDDLEKAIQYELRAIDLTPNGHPHLASRLTNLGTSYMQRFQHQDELSDLQKAIHCQSRAVSSTPDGHPHLAAMYLHSAMSSLLSYQKINDRSHLDHTLHSFRMATQSTGSAPRDRFQFARHWTKLAPEHSALNPIEAYRTTIDLLPQFVWLGATANQRYQDLSTAETLAVDAAHAAILSLDHALALEWLEHARCVVWTQNLMLSSPLDQLQSSHPDLAAHLQTVAIQLRSASSDTRESQSLTFNSKDAEEVAQEHRRLAQEYDRLLAQTRKLAGFEDFLRPIKAKSLICAARHGPIVVINCHADRCDALIVRPSQDHVECVPLPNFSGEMAMRVRIDIESAVRSVQAGERGAERRPVVETEHNPDFRSVLRVLWHDIVKPILKFMGYMNDASAGSLPHITWCPTGAISFLPLHAAGDYDQPGSRVFDYVISSYTPTLAALLKSTPSALRPDSRVLAIGQAATPGHSPLPGTNQEIMKLKTHTTNKVEYSQLIDHEATKAAVLDAMEQHDWVHLACHAHQNVADPTKSGFFLHDDVLDLASINRRSFKNKGLAFLSACQTATGDEKLPDEAVHLASGMLMAGYTCVIATMWSVVDEDAPVVADTVYAELLREGKVGSGEAGRALHNAVAALRRQVGETAFERWVPYIHIGS